MMIWLAFSLKNSVVITIWSIFHFYGIFCVKEAEVKTLPILMPKVQPLKSETYLCIAHKAPVNDVINIVEILPIINPKTAHHILIFGCKVPGTHFADEPDYVWNCGMTVHSEKYAFAPACQRGTPMQFIYTWSEGGIPVKMPHGVGFKVGKGTGIDYIVVQIHYSNVIPFKYGATDSSGVILRTLPSWDSRITKSAGLLLLVTDGIIPPHENVNLEVACKMTEPLTIHPFAFHPHTHKLGKVVSGYKIDEKGNWHLIGKGDPQAPQKFFPIEKDIPIYPGDIVAGRCTLYNFHDKEVRVGETRADEMCNFYMLYYVEGNKTLDKKFCVSLGAPYYYWKYDMMIDHIPAYIDHDASTLHHNYV